MPAAQAAPDNRAPVLQVRDLVVRTAGAHGREVVRGVGFDIRPGETLCIVGESGSGKSVSSFAIMGLLPPDSLRAAGGSILVDGEDVLQASPARLRQLRATRMAMVFQEPMTALSPVEPVGRQIDEVLCIHTRLDRAARRARVLEMLAAVHLPDPERIYASYPHQLSGGQRQRVVICMALILQPRLLIADEPTTALDVTTQKQILALIRELQVKHNTAVLFITHDFGVVAEIADRVVVMHRGSVVETGAREDILARPAQPYTRMLVSSVPSLVPEPRPPKTADVVLDVEGVAKTYETRQGLRRRAVAAAVDIHLRIRRGEILGVVGESGSGKSTVARCVARLHEPSAGAIRVHGEDITHKRGEALRRMRRRVQMVFQDPYRSLNPRVRIGESLIEGMSNYGEDEKRALHRVRELLALVGLDDDAMARYPHQFSGGQRQRICIARALALEPDILIADEAVSALDVSVQAQVLALLDEVRARTGVAVLFVTHDLRVAAQICDSIVVMQKGHIVESGRALDVLTAPNAAYTRTLLDAAPGRHWDFRHFRPAPAA
ncbi:dipeptide ABC transporter ATP-binding protein [Achromobacter aloeverae]|uniref:Microcin ABC transporter ATP-binding protein n=1 Tax=Achromobacter aloeverae TaxID=1750518 RepID=A0A4Q1HFU4_9BURK|nr:ABC transporter ATP-binding protein [Achromobacter aloeverae]RXN85995.1 microcin ABC transporter ATP-binding protein [Achromobacter aloeverae]